MCKVTGPMHSDGASGQFAKSMVFGNWKGVNVVRKYVIPANPMSSGQGDQRIIMGGTGRVAGKVTVAGDVNGQFATLGVVPAGQSKQSYLVKYILDHILVDASALAAIQSEFAGHTADTDFTAEALALGLADFDLSYATAAPFTKGEQLYVLAKALIAIGLTGSPYTTALASWTLSEIQAMVADL
ncbi:MAG: hypothetical protein WAV16_02045 [Candidatus Moraniibacteriota bacterium]